MKYLLSEEIAETLKLKYGKDILNDVVIIGNRDRVRILRAGRPQGRRPVPVSHLRVKELRAQGWSWRAIGRELHCDPRTCRKVLG